MFLYFFMGIIYYFWNLSGSLSSPKEFRVIKYMVLSVIACILVPQNISGGVGVGSSAMIFLLGALMGVIADEVPSKV